MEKRFTSFDDAGIYLPNNYHASTTGEVAMTCPECSSSRKKEHQTIKCLSVNVEEKVWNCHNCGFAGALVPSDGRPQTKKRTYRRPQPLPATETPKWLYRWFEEERKIPEAIVRQEKVTATTHFFGAVGAERQAITYPYYRKNELVSLKFITYEKYADSETGEEKKRKLCEVSAGSEAIFWGIDTVQGSTVYITEGESDRLTLLAAGFSPVIAVPNGAPSPESKNLENKFSYLRSAQEGGHLEPLEKIVLCVDTDAPGKKLAEELTTRLGPDRCWVASWPEGCKDANEVLQQYGMSTLQECIETAKPPAVRGVVHLNDLMPELERIYDEGMPGGVHPGWDSLAPFYRPREKELSVITGQPAAGKTRLMSNLFVNLAKDHGWKFTVFSPENGARRYFIQLIEQYSGLPFNGPHAMSKYDFWDVAPWVNEHFTIIAPGDARYGGQTKRTAKTENPTMEWILGVARLQVLDRGIKGLVIDPWSWVYKDIPRGQILPHYVQEQLQLMKGFLDLYNCHGFITAHPTKSVHKEEKGEYAGLIGPTSLYDISDGASWNNTADMGLSVWRNTVTNSPVTEVHVLKVRFEENGQTGKAKLLYDVRSKKYYDIGTQPDHIPYMPDYD